MQFKIGYIEFKEVLAQTTNVCDNKMFPNVLLEVLDSETMRVTCMGQSVSARKLCEVKSKETGAIAVNAQKLLKMVQGFEDEIDIRVDKNGWAKIKCAKSNYRLAGIDAVNFPEFPEPPDSVAKIDSDVLDNLIDATAYAITNEESRYALNGVKLAIEKGTATMVATDGSRIAIIEDEGEGTIDCMLPKDTLRVLSKLPLGIVAIAETPNALFFEIDNLTLAIRKFSGSFPDMSQVAGILTKYTMKVAVEPFNKAFKRIINVADDRIPAVTLSFNDKELILTTASQEEGEGEEVLEVDYQGEPVVLRLNATFLSDFLRVKGKEIVFKFTDDKQPVKLNYGDDRYTCLIMPLRLV